MRQVMFMVETFSLLEANTLPYKEMAFIQARKLNNPDHAGHRLLPLSHARFDPAIPSLYFAIDRSLPMHWPEVQSKHPPPARKGSAGAIPGR